MTAGPRFSRESRLLLLTLAASVVLLLVLARFRFPEEQGVPTLPVRPPSAPLERLAARATYDELASIVGDLERRIAPALVVLRVEATGGGRLPGASPGDAGMRTSVALRWVPGVRVRPDAVLARVELGASVMGIVGSDARPELQAYDPLRGLAIVRVPPVSDAPPSIWEAGTPRPLSGHYVAVVEGTLGGPTLRPTFLGRADPIVDVRWNGPLLVLGGELQAPAGSLVFSLDARLVGMSVLEEGSLAIVPAQALLEAVDALTHRPPRQLGDLGIEVQALTPTLAAATDTATGVMVAWVDPEGPAAGLLRFGDVIERIGGTPVGTARAFGILEARVPPGTEVIVRVVRDDEYVDVAVVAASATPPEDPDRAARLGLVMRARTGSGTEIVSVEDGTAGSRAELAPGDLITSIGDQARPTPAQVRRAYADAGEGAWLLVGVLRGDRHIVVALEKR